MLIAKMPDGTPEIYPAFQGEGINITENCVFVRLAGCNLSCSFCDTAYTWLWEGSHIGEDYHEYSEKVKRSDYVLPMTIDEVADKIRDALGTYTTRVIFTGGEPLLQQQDIVKVIDNLLEQEDISFELETNGTILLSPELANRLDTVNCSPKLAFSGNAETMRNVPEAIERIKKLGHSQYTICWKFVVNPDDIDKSMKEVIRWQAEHDIPCYRVWLMPEGITRDRITKGSNKVWEYCYANNYNFCPRLQVLLYDDKRAV